MSVPRSSSSNKPYQSRASSSHAQASSSNSSSTLPQLIQSLNLQPSTGENLSTTHRVTTYDRATSSHEQASSSNSGSSSLPSMDEDVMPPNHFFVSGRIHSFDLGDNGRGTLVLRVSKETEKRMNIQLAKHLVKEGMPAAALEKCREIACSNETIQIQTAALQQLEHTYDAEYQLLDKKVQEGKASKQEQQRYAAVINKWQEFKKHVANSVDKEKLLKEKWESQTEKYYQFIRNYFKNLDRKSFDKVDVTFYSLRELNPQSSNPFLPLFIFPFLFPDGFLQYVLEEWYKIQPHLAFGIPFSLATVSLESDQPFRQEAGKNILQWLKKLYPKNVLLLAQLNEMTKEIAHQQISQCLTKGINLIRLNKFEDAANFLSNQRSYFEGVAFWYRYLTLTLALNDNPKAFAMMAKALQVPNLEESGLVPPVGMFERLLSITKKCFPIQETKVNKEEIKNKTEPDPLQKFIRVMQNINESEKGIASIKDFIQECILCFKEDNSTKNLPFIYFGVQWVASRIPTNEDFIKISSIFMPLFDLLSCCTSAMFDFDCTDPWFLETFKLVPAEAGEGESEEMQRFKVNANFSKLSFGRETIELSEMQFDGVELSIDSGKMMLVALAKQLYQIIMSVMVNPSFRCISEDFSASDIPLPDSVGIFKDTLDHGFRMGIQKLGYQNLAFKNAKHWLQVYLDASKKPYDLDDSFIEWARFSLSSCSDFGSLPENFEIQLTQFQRLLKSLKLISDRDVDRLCLRDALNGQMMLTQLDGEISFSENDSVYLNFEKVQNILGWNMNESFQEWGQRLLNRRGTVNDLFVNNMPPLYRSLLNFWIEFYQKTTEKNVHIAGGGEEDSAKKTEKWGRESDINRNLWLQIVRENKFKLYPNYNGLSAKDKTALQEIVKNKYDHGKEVEELRGVYRTSNQENTPVLMSAALLRSALYERSSGVHHSIYVETEEQARQIYQILLNVSVDRLIRYHLIPLGYSHWKAETIQSPENFFGSILAKLIGTFHGLETHITGNGPIQSHYNAGIVIPGGSIVNTHIYFG